VLDGQFTGVEAHVGKPVCLSDCWVCGPVHSVMTG
jgi:hypothetical protein